MLDLVIIGGLLPIWHEVLTLLRDRGTPGIGVKIDKESFVNIQLIEKDYLTMFPPVQPDTLNN